MLVAIAALSALSPGCTHLRPAPEPTLATLKPYGEAFEAFFYTELHERPLATTTATGDTVVRMFYSQALAGTRMWRVERRGASWLFVQKYIGERGQTPIEADSATISPLVVDSLLAVIRASNYWQRAPIPCHRAGMDGQSVTLEARFNDQYHATHCFLIRRDSLPSEVGETVTTFYWIASQAPGRLRPP